MFKTHRTIIKVGFSKLHSAGTILLLVKKFPGSCLQKCHLILIKICHHRDHLSQVNQKYFGVRRK